MNTMIMIFVSLVLVILFVGIVIFAMGGEANKKYGVQLMWMRVGTQAVVVVIVALGMFIGGY